MDVMNAKTLAESDTKMDLEGRVATRVRMAMAARRKSVKELALVLHLSERAAQRRRSGGHPFSLRELEAVGKWLEVSPVTLLTGAGLEDIAA